MNNEGIALALAGTTAYNTGFVLEKRALSALPPIDVHQPRQLLRTLFTAPGWLAGFVCMAVGLACQVAVLAILPLTVAQPLQASGIGVLLVLAWLVLGERAGRRDWWRVAAIVVAVALLGLSAEDGATPGDQQAHPAVMAGVVVLSGVVAVSLYLEAHGRITARHRMPATGVAAGLATGLLYGIAGLGLKGLSSDVAGHGLFAALLAAPASPYLYLTLGACAGGMAVFQTALQRCRATVLIPTANAAGSSYVIFLGSLLFHESLPSHPAQLVLRIAGLLATAVALVIQPNTEQSPTPERRSLESEGLTPWHSTNGFSWFSPAPSTKAPCSISPRTRPCTTPGCDACTASSRTSR
jgi:drug/metabolite transporter (DMT)-like permease